MITRETQDALNALMRPAVWRRLMITGMLPMISMTAKSTALTLRTSMGLKKLNTRANVHFFTTPALRQTGENKNSACPAHVCHRVTPGRHSAISAEDCPVFFPQKAQKRGSSAISAHACYRVTPGRHFAFSAGNTRGFSSRTRITFRFPVGICARQKVPWRFVIFGVYESKGPQQGADHLRAQARPLPQPEVPF